MGGNLRASLALLAYYRCGMYDFTTSSNNHPTFKYLCASKPLAFGGCTSPMVVDA